MKILFLFFSSFFSLSLFAGVVLSEINFDPTCANDDCEYVELYNAGPGDEDISGWTISDGETGLVEWGLTFPSTTIIASGEFIIVTKDVTSFLAEYPFYSGQLFEISNNGSFAGLANTGDEVFLTDNTSTVVADYIYPDLTASVLEFDGSTWLTGQPPSPGSNSYLPVELMELEITAGDNSVLLTWVTATEENNDYFEIMHSADGIQFSPIGRVDGAGTSLVPIGYSYEHFNPNKAVNYYKLLQVDLDGTSSFSRVISVRLHNSTDTRWQIWPSVVSDNRLKFRFEDSKEVNVFLRVFDSQGNLFIDEKVSPQTETGELDISQLPQGMFYIKLIEPTPGAALNFYKF